MLADGEILERANAGDWRQRRALALENAAIGLLVLGNERCHELSVVAEQTNDRPPRHHMTIGEQLMLAHRYGRALGIVVIARIGERARRIDDEDRRIDFL